MKAFLARRNCACGRPLWAIISDEWIVTLCGSCDLPPGKPVDTRDMVEPGPATGAGPDDSGASARKA